MKLTPNQKRAMRRLWRGGLTLDEIAEELSLSSVDFGDCETVDFTADVVVAIAEWMGLPERVDPNDYVPSPEQIRMACAEIRQGWTPSEREARIGGGSAGRIKEATGDHNHAGGSAPGDCRP
jgi:hypothetical protein